MKRIGLLLILFSGFFLWTSGLQADPVTPLDSPPYPEHPRRIVSLAPSATEIVFALERGSRLKGVSRYSNYPLQAETLPRVGSYVNLDVEKIAAIDPDLCIAVTDGNPRDVIDRLTGLGIPVFAINPKNLNEVMASIRAMGRLLKAEDRAAEIVKDMKQRINRIETIVSKSAKKPTVFFQIGISPIVAVGSDTFIHQLITMAGGQNLTSGPAPYPRYSVEQVLALAPDVIIITSMARGTVFESVKAQWSRWKQIPAVRDKRIFLVNSDIVDRGSPRLVEGLEVLTRLFHPDQFRGTPQ